MMDITTAISALSTTLGIAKTAIEVRDDVQAKLAIADATTKQLELTMAALDLTNTISQLQAKNAELESKQRDLVAKLSERAAYRLHELAPGTFCYKFQPPDGSNEPTHYLCQICYDKGKKVVLRHVKTDIGDLLHCGESDNKHDFYL